MATFSRSACSSSDSRWTWKRVNSLSLKEQAERENVAIYALALPEFGKAFVSDTFSLQGVSRAEKGGFKGGVDLGNLVAVLRRSSHAEKHADPSRS